MRLNQFGITAGLVVLALFCTASTPRAEMKIGYIDAQEILAKYKPYQDAEREYQRYEEELRREISKQQNDLVQMQEDYKRQELMLSDNRKQEEQQAMMKKQQDLERFVSEITDPERGKLVLKNQSLSEPIFREVNEVVTEVAKAEGYHYLLNTSALAYADESLNLTETVLEKLEKKL